MQPTKALVCQSHCPLSECRKRAKRFGFFRRHSDGALLQRFRCRRCGRSFSDATDSPCYRQKKRQINSTLFSLLASGHSQRRCALSLALNRKTVVRKFLFLGRLAAGELERLNARYPKVAELQFDDMESFEHTKCKPLSIPLAVEHKSRRILGFEVARMPAKGVLIYKAHRKYGPRADERGQARNKLFSRLKALVSRGCVFSSDENPHYPEDVQRHFPGHTHRVFKGRRGCVVGQGELKRGGYDPLFSLNHTAAMLRDNIKRLARRSWCTTKKPECLAHHIAIYALYHNEFLLKQRSPARQDAVRKLISA